MKRAITFLFMGFMAGPALAESDWNFASLSWDYSDFSKKEVVPALKECLRKTDNPDQWQECIELFSLPCEATISNFDVCYAIEAKAWGIIVESEFQQVLAKFSNYQGLNWQQPFEALCETQKHWISFTEANCDFYSQRSGGSSRRTDSVWCEQRENFERAIELKKLRIKPRDSGMDFTDIPSEVIRKAGKSCDLRAVDGE